MPFLRPRVHIPSSRARFAVVAALLLFSSGAIGAQQPTYDRLNDSTKWVSGNRAMVIWSASGEGPTCASAAEIVFEREAVDYGSIVQSIEAEIARPERPILTALIDDIRVRVEGTIGKRAAKLGEGEFVAQWRYPVPDSLLVRLRTASSFEARDDRTHSWRMTQRHFRLAPPICVPQDNPS